MSSATSAMLIFFSGSVVDEMTPSFIWSELMGSSSFSAALCRNSSLAFSAAAMTALPMW
jgi:hypothetical protein